MPKYKVSFYIEAEDEDDAIDGFIASDDPETDFEFDVEEVVIDPESNADDEKESEDE